MIDELKQKYQTFKDTDLKYNSKELVYREKRKKDDNRNNVVSAARAGNIDAFDVSEQGAKMGID